MYCSLNCTVLQNCRVLETADRLWAAERVTAGCRNISNCLSITTKVGRLTWRLVGLTDGLYLRRSTCAVRDCRRSAGRRVGGWRRTGSSTGGRRWRAGPGLWAAVRTGRGGEEALTRTVLYRTEQGWSESAGQPTARIQDPAHGRGGWGSLNTALTVASRCCGTSAAGSAGRRGTSPPQPARYSVHVKAV